MREHFIKVTKELGQIYENVDLKIAEKEIAEIKKYVVGLENKLSNKEFVDNAPKAVVEKEQDKLSEAKSKLEKLEEQLKNLV